MAISKGDDDPYWIVESSKTGKRAAHKESALSTSWPVCRVLASAVRRA